MDLTRTSLSSRANQGYWKAVGDLLQANYQLSSKASRLAIANYRAVLSKGGVGDIVYHAPIEQTAEGIVVGEYAPVSASTNSKKKPKIA